MSLFVLIPDPAQAYLGPGSGLTAIGSILALVGVIGLGIVGFIWYPIKRLINKLRGGRKETENSVETSDD
ncbi:hypothetical protein HF685_10990 [Parasphingorhabdus halotolerans]|uniref:Uncharacterized protein n=2 Tax=Parasphingorhabdus halotolerans TaxID=2725558 RepID=A0A6H2DQ72_9SPHN|nr:hypothetical protein HF685_10990 [Parasphingorhabdus halotolerans]